MERSYAFELIDDPMDPAWHGHADAPMPWRRTRAVSVAAAAMAFVFVVVVFAITLTHAGDARPRPPAASPSDTATEPSAEPVVETTNVPAASNPSTSVAPPSQEYELSPAEVEAYVRTWSASEGGSTFGRPGALVGDVRGLGPSLSAGLEGLAMRLNRSLVVISGTRTRAEQVVLYARFQAGTGNLAAPPGTSRHETGEAADVYVDGIALAEVPGARRTAASLGLGFPVPGESWHIERVPSA